MCGRFTQFFSWADLVAATGGFIDMPTPDAGHKAHGPRYNIAPSQDALVLHIDRSDTQVGSVRWGFPNPRSPGEVIHARSETAADLPMFRDAMHSRRCLIPADAFYEWEPRGDGTKQPWAFASDRPLFLLAGLWSGSNDLRRFVILTCATPTDFMPAIHHRMPCVVRPEDARAWLDPSRMNAETAAGVLHAFGDTAAFPTRSWPVSTRVNAPKNDDPRLLEPVTLELGLFG